MMARGNVSRYSKKINDAIIGAAKLLLDIWKGTKWWSQLTENMDFSMYNKLRIR